MIFKDLDNHLVGGPGDLAGSSAASSMWDATTRFLDDDGVPFVTEYLSVRIFFMRGGGNKRRIIVLFYSKKY